MPFLITVLGLASLLVKQHQPLGGRDNGFKDLLCNPEGALLLVVHPMD